MSPIRILLVDDDELFRDGLQTILSIQPDFEIVGEADNGQTALQLATTLLPDVVLMDVQMPLMDGLTATHRLKANYPCCRIIVLTTFDANGLEQDAAQAGAECVLLKDISADKLIQAIRRDPPPSL
jgi:DNA-binding NarL/FixJ family response regulator